MRRSLIPIIVALAGCVSTQYVEKSPPLMTSQDSTYERVFGLYSNITREFLERDLVFVARGSRRAEAWLFYENRHQLFEAGFDEDGQNLSIAVPFASPPRGSEVTVYITRPIGSTHFYGWGSNRTELAQTVLSDNRIHAWPRQQDIQTHLELVAEAQARDIHVTTAIVDYRGVFKFTVGGQENNRDFDQSLELAGRVIRQYQGLHLNDRELIRELKDVGIRGSYTSLTDTLALEVLARPVRSGGQNGFELSIKEIDMPR